MGIGSIVFGAAFYHDGILKYRLSDISGIAGIFISLLSLCLLPFWSFFTWLYLCAGFLCLYAVLVPVISSIYGKMDGNTWEKGAVTAFVSFLIVYFSSYHSNILINELFLVDPKHFPFTSVVAMLVVIAPIIFILSLFLILYYSYRLFKSERKKERKSFYSLNGQLASMFLFIFSLAFVGGGENIIKNVAAVVDFNPKSICQNSHEANGVIYLDNKYELILMHLRDGDSDEYRIANCKIGT